MFLLYQNKKKYIKKEKEECDNKMGYLRKNKYGRTKEHWVGFFFQNFSLILNEKRDILVIFKEVDG